MTTDRKPLALASLVMSLGLLRLVAGQSTLPQSDTMVFEHVNVIEGLSDTLALDTTVVVTNGKIASVGKPRGSCPARK